MGNPRNASLNAGGFRYYNWVPADGSKPTSVISVTSIARLSGLGYRLHEWILANLVDAAMGTMKRTVIGPRGGVSKKRVIDIFPSEFAEKYAETEGKQGEIDALRRWLRNTADEPRNIAAARGSLVHEAIEKSIRADRIERPWVEAAFAGLTDKDKRRVGDEVKDEDVAFIHNAMRQYEDMRVKVPFVILAREVQVWNLKAGYGGTADVFMWFLPEGTPQAEVDKWQKLANNNRINAATIREVGGHVAMGDWKTSEDVHTDHVVQITAYMAAEFVGSDGVVDERLTAILRMMTEGVLIHIRPDLWDVDFVPWGDDIALAFFGRCAFARFMARFEKPQELFSKTIHGKADTQ